MLIETESNDVFRFFKDNSDKQLMNDPTPRLGAPSNIVIQAIRGVLKPLVRFMLSQGLTYTILIDLLKSIYVEVALKEFTLEKKRQTDSRISLLTGVHRKDVKPTHHHRKTSRLAHNWWPNGLANRSMSISKATLFR